MQLNYLFQAESPIPAHALAAVFAIVLGVAQLFLPKGTAIHRALGRFWIVLMVFVAISGFFISELRMLGPFSIVHLLSAYVLFGLFNGVMAARKGEIERHKRAMTQLYFWGLLVAGAFTLAPGRVMYNVLFDQAP